MDKKLLTMPDFLRNQENLAAEKMQQEETKPDDAQSRAAKRSELDRRVGRLDQQRGEIMFYEELRWKAVQEHGYPHCDSETIFVGKNSAGYCGCFNEHGLMSTSHGQRSVCLYATAEGRHEVMTDLAWWAEMLTPNE